jgi:capsular polysaccharide biosynthesis protein
MDLWLILQKIWRHKLFTLPVIALTLAGAAYVVAVKKPTYEATSSYILINPPAPPTAEDIARDPALGRVNADNPYTRFPDESVVVDVLARTVGSDSARHELVRAGADERYTVASAAHFGSSSPIVQITGTGASPEAAIHTANVVGRAVADELARMQRVQHVDSRYWITAFEVEVPDHAQLRASGQLRMLVGILGLGAILLFIVISVMDALAAIRAERLQGATLTRLPPGRPPLNAASDPGSEARWEPVNGNGGQYRRWSYRYRRAGGSHL